MTTIAETKTRSPADADKPTRRVYWSVKVMHQTWYRSIC